MIKKIIKAFIKAFLYATPALILAAYLFMPFYALSFENQSSFRLSGLKLLVVNLRVEGTLVTLPVITRILSALLAAAPLIAAAFIVKKKKQWCGIAMLSSSILAGGLSLSLSLISKTAESSGGALGAYTHNPEVGLTAIILLSLLSGAIALFMWNREKLFENVLLLFSTAAIASVIVITGFMIFMGAPAIARIGIFDMLFGTVWKPTAASPSYGIGAMVLTTISATAGAVVIGAPIGILTAVFIAELAPPALARIIRPAIDLLAGIPSVIYGFFGMMVIVPAVRDIFNVTVGDGLFSAILILAVMILPTVVSITETSLRAVPESIKEASLGLGATHIQSIFKIILPAARSGIAAALILGIGRAIGETMAVIMVAGNVVNMPSLFVPVRPMTAGIVLEMAYSAGLHRQALFAIGLLLFLFIALVNLGFKFLLGKAEKRYEA